MISIITITYNNLGGLKKTAQSILEQSQQNYQWIIIDGNSNDGTKDHLTTLPATFISEPDKGIYDAMNKGIERAGGNYLLFLNAGDQLAEPETLTTLETIIQQQNEPDFIYGPALEERQNGTNILKTALSSKYLFWGMMTHHQAMLYKRVCLNELKYDISYKIAGDYDFTCRFLKRAKHIYITKEPICIFEAGGISQTSAIIGRKEQFQIRSRQKIVYPPFNHLIYLAQSLSLLIKHNMPCLYWWLRTRRQA